MRFDTILTCYITLALARIEAHRQPDGLLSGKFESVVRADRSGGVIKDRMLEIVPGTAVPKGPHLSLSMTREVPLYFRTRFASHRETAYAECWELAALVQETMLMDPQTRAYTPMLEQMVGEGAERELVAISINPGAVTAPAPVRGQQNLYMAQADITGDLETNL